MQTYHNQESIVRPLEVEYPIGFVRLNTNITERTDKKGDVEFKTYLYTATDYTLSEYSKIQDDLISTLSSENTKVWDTVYFLIEQLGYPPQAP